MTGGIHPTAIIDTNAEIAVGVEIGPYCVIGSGAKLASGVRLHNQVTITGNTSLAEDVEVFSGAVLGMTPQIVNYQESGATQLEIGARTVLREHVTINTGSQTSTGITTVGADCMLMIGTHIGHDCQIGDKCVIANDAQLGGHVVLGEQVWIGGLAGIHQFSRIGKHAFVGASSMIVADLIPYGVAIGNHAHLAGLNIVGLKRRGFSRKALHSLRAGYKMLFSGRGSFVGRVADVSREYANSPEVIDIVAFIQSEHKRPLCQPE